MPALKERIINLLQEKSGLTDREITDILIGPRLPQQSVNQICRQLETKGKGCRRERHDGRIGNYMPPLEFSTPIKSSLRGSLLTAQPKGEDPLSENGIKHSLNVWLVSEGWRPIIVWDNARGIDIDATKGGQRWIIEVKGWGSYEQMRVNYFLTVLGEILQRMKDGKAKYSIALPDLKQFRNLWGRLPQIAKQRIGMTAIFVDQNGNIDELN